MRRTLCGMCDEPSRFKMAAFYWNWTWPSGLNLGYKQFFDAQCAANVVKQLQDPDAENEPCAECKQEIPDGDEVAMWVTYYVPGFDRQDAYMHWHQNCFVNVEDRFMHNGTRLSPRGASSVGGGGPPAPNPWSSWSAQGIDPR